MNILPEIVAVRLLYDDGTEFHTAAVRGRVQVGDEYDADGFRAGEAHYSLIEEAPPGPYRIFVTLKADENT